MYTKNKTLITTINAKAKLLVATFKNCDTPKGIPEAIPAMIIREIPLPIPLSVICSPSHIKNIVPVTKQIIVEK